MAVTARLEGRWFVDGRRLEDGDLVEIRDVPVAGFPLEDWYPAVAFDDGQQVELDAPADPEPGNRAVTRTSVSLERIVRDGGEIRRREPPSVRRGTQG